MQQLAFVVLAVLGVAYAAFTVPIYFRFSAYCEQVAKATGRERENQEFRNADENGNNAFQREQYRKLRTGEFKELSDPMLVAQASALAAKLRLSCWLAVGLVVTSAASVFWA
jgi:hypothetical protein